MKSIILCLITIPISCLMSCSDKKELPKEETIRIIVEHETGDTQTEPPGQLSKTIHVDTNQPKAEDQSSEAFLSRQEARVIIRNMRTKDPQIKEFIRQGNVARLAEYLLNYHNPEIDAISEGSEIRDKRKTALQLSRIMIRRGQQFKKINER